MENNEIIVKLSKLETTVEHHDRQLQLQQDKNDLLMRMVESVEQQGESIKELTAEFRESNKQVFASMNEMTKTLTSLNSNQESLKNEIVNVKNEISTTNSRITEVEKKHEEQDDYGKFDVLGFLSKDLPKMVAVALVTAILVYIGWIK